ncbi:hypothetical protein VCHA37P200_70202 [Vibrio chagasii]|nr:hypothetical protein VCHA34P112_340037 [Vibrio chagasii]CAH7037433.1 hypothetical protein VCHA35P150_60038 [Vibrio chagasii]CAH7052304.1 hypothetical protein VCHA34P129_70204 [Vibrio chagasii]CAH7213681.1 hypothetical protein VCHA56P515_320012 [Vibrio chagasii]CAH7286234.1 hypothetical protein VCHA53O463_340037 [Vibrio chagasii]
MRAFSFLYSRCGKQKKMRDSSKRVTKSQKQVRDTGKRVTKNMNCDSRTWYIADSNLGMFFVFLISFTHFYS